jgi:hypothetical protein
MTQVIGLHPRVWHAEGVITSRPPFLESLPPDRLVHLDVREDIRRGKAPFARIMATVERLGPDQVLVLRAPFEPIPLCAVLGMRGFGHWTESRAPDDWSVWFWRGDSGLVGAGRAP